MKSSKAFLFPFTLLLLFVFFLTEFSFSQQYTMSGKVIDKQNRQALAFVNILVNEGQYGGMSDINGKYTVSCQEPVHTMRFSCLGYESVSVTVKPDQQRLDVALQPMTFQLGEVTIEAGENPAHRIIDSVMAHRKENHPNSLDSYRYQIYDQMVITIDSSEFGKMLDTVKPSDMTTWLDSVLKKNDLMIMETFSEVLYQSPNHLRQNVLGTKMSGSKDNQLVYLVSKMQSTSFYDETVSIAGTDYVNPISKNSKKRYFFTLESVTPAAQGDSLYTISFHPLRGSTFDGLQGVMTIHSDGWALQNVKATPVEEGGLYTVSIQQLYQKMDGQWFPKQLNTNLVFPAIQAKVDGVSFPMIAVGKSYVSNVELHPVFDDRAFSEVEVMVHEDAAYRDDEFWTQHRIDSLTERILNTYHLMDSLTEGNNILDRMLNATNKLMQESAVSLGPVDLQLGSMLRLSALRGLYIGLHLSTNDRLSRHLRFSGFNGFWTRLRDFDYGLEGKWLIQRQRQMELGMRFAHRSDAMGEFNGFGEGENLLSEKEYRYTFYENIMERGERTEVFFNTRFARHFKAFVTAGVYDKNYRPAYAINHVDTTSALRLVKAELKLRFAYQEKFLSSTDGIQSLGTDYPILWMAYQHFFKGILGGERAFNRVKFQVEKDFQTRYYGRLSVLMQAGYASEGCPVMETFNLLGSYERFGLYSPGSFATMSEGEFFCNRFAALFLSHDFQGSLWSLNSTWFNPQLVLSTALGWGTPSLSKGFFESGIVLKGLLNTPLANMGLGVFYRYGAYAHPKVFDNFAFKYSITINL
jgi:hypothetical protein